MRKSRCAACVVAVLLAVGSAGTHAQLNRPGALRIVMLVDSSTTVSQMVPQFRAAMSAFLDELPGTPEIALISTGGQLRIRVPPTSDREQLRKAFNSFAADGGGNSFLETLLEADQRFLANAGQRPVFVIMMTDGTEARGDARVDRYNDWVELFLARDGRAHGVVVSGARHGFTSELLMNLTKNTGGFYEALTVPNALPDRMRALAAMVAADMIE